MSAIFVLSHLFYGLLLISLVGPVMDSSLPEFETL